MKKILIVCTTDSMIWNFLVPHINFMRSKGFVVECACSKTGFFYDELVNMGIVLHEIPFKRNPFRLNNIKAYINLLNLIKSNEYDLIQCHEPVGGAMGRLAGKSCRKEVMYFAHGFHFYKGAPKKTILYYIFERILSYLTDILITINQEDFETSKKFHAKKNYLIHGIGIDTSRFTRKINRSYLKSEFNLSLENKYLLSIGELIHRKNHITVIRSLKTLPNNIHYLIVGDGELKKYLINEVQNLGIADRVHFLGFRKDISLICNAVDIFVFPSLQEGLSVALMEAMAIGLPIIASNIRGNNDLIEDSKGGYLVTDTNPDEYSSKVKLLINNPNLMSNFGQFNTKKIELFDIKVVLKEVEEILNTI